jgi:hypothetical protein
MDVTVLGVLPFDIGPHLTQARQIFDAPRRQVVNTNTVCRNVDFFGNVRRSANAKGQLNAASFKQDAVNARQKAKANFCQFRGKLCGSFACESSEKKLRWRFRV